MFESNFTRTPSGTQAERAEERKRLLPTSVLLQDPAFELYDRVSEGAAVLPLAAVANLVAAHVELAEGVQRTHLAVAHISRPHHMHQAPATEKRDV